MKIYIKKNATIFLFWSWIKNNVAKQMILAKMFRNSSAVLVLRIYNRVCFSIKSFGRAESYLLAPGSLGLALEFLVSFQAAF